MNTKPTLTAFAYDLIVAMGLPKTVLKPTRSGFYIQIEGAQTTGGIAQIDLWHGQADDQHALLGLSWRGGDKKYRAVITVDKPVMPLKNLISSVFPKGEKSTLVTRAQALVVIGTMVKYLEMTR